MLTIRNAQMQVFNDYMRTNFEDRVIRHIAADFPNEFAKLAGDPRDFVRKGCGKAETYGIETERDVSRFIDLMLRFGVDFELDQNMQWAAAILRDQGISGRAKIDFIYEDLPARMSEDE